MCGIVFAYQSMMCKNFCPWISQSEASSQAALVKKELQELQLFLHNYWQCIATNILSKGGDKIFVLAITTLVYGTESLLEELQVSKLHFANSECIKR